MIERESRDITHERRDVSCRLLSECSSDHDPAVGKYLRYTQRDVVKIFGKKLLLLGRVGCLANYKCFLRMFPFVVFSSLMC